MSVGLLPRRELFDEGKGLILGRLLELKLAANDPTFGIVADYALTVPHSPEVEKIQQIGLNS